MSSQKASFLPISHSQSKATPANIPPNRKITNKFPNAFCSGPFTKAKSIFIFTKPNKYEIDSYFPFCICV